jgi:hypothetical protein
MGISINRSVSGCSRALTAVRRPFAALVRGEANRREGVTARLWALDKSVSGHF